MQNVITPLIQNAALLLATMVVFDLVSRRRTMLDRKPQQLLAGLILGGLCLGLMHSAFRLETGILFDTRSVLLSLSGLFFGVIPTVLAMTMAAAFRLWQGGAGTWMGVSVILATGGMGLLWRHYRRKQLEDISLWELYGFGVVVHLVMLALMLTLPAGAAWRALEGIALPVMLVYPAATVALGGLLANRLSRENATGLLTASEEQYRHLFQKHAAVKLLINPEDGRIVDANDAAAAFYGWPLDTLRRMNVSEINTLPTEQINTEMAKAQEDQRVYFEFKHRLADGSARDVAVYSSKVDVAGKELLHLIVHDITEGKRAEEALNRKQAMLARTEAAVHVGSWEWEAEGDKVTWSDELFRIFGLEPADEAPPFAEHQAFYVPEDRARLARAVEECVTKGIPYDLEVRVTRCDGELRHCLVRGFPERDTDGVVKRLYGSLQDITEIRRAEERITTLSHMLDDAPASITIHDTEGRFIFANAATASLHGYESMEEFMEVDLHDLDVPESEAAIAERMQKIAEEGEARFEVEHYRKDGSTFPLDVLAKQIEWEGRPAILSIAADITERRMAEDRLKRSYDLLKNLAAQVPGVIYQYRLFPDGRSCFPYSSPGIWKIYEVTPEEVEQDATPVFGRLHPEDADRVAEAIFESARTLETFYCEFRVVLPDQGLRWRWSQAEPQRTEDGGTLWHGIILDITDRKQAEENLMESEARFKALHNASFGGITIHDKGVILECNQGLSEITGYDYDELIGMDGLLLIAEKSREEVMSNILSGYEKPYEVYGVRKDGEEYPLRLEARNIPYEGKPLRVVEFRDITEQKQAEAEREKLQSQLTQSQKMESVGRLAGGVAHDFNNMLNVILGHSELALDDLAADSPLRDGIEEIRKAAERSANLTRQLLAFARRQTVAPKNVDLNETIASMLKMLERLIGEDIDLLWKPGTRLDLVRIDPGQVDQMLANLAVNARDAIGHANGKITIETGNVCFDEEYCAAHAGFLAGDYVMLAVSDDGCGMDEETRAQIFEPFFTTKGVGEGTGLGLATIYGIVKQNDGFVNVYSEPGKGTTFRIYLPALEAESSRHENVRTSDAPAVGGNETILIVEDEAAILNLTRMMLERLGYTILTAGTPSEALRVAREQQGKIDLLITDVVMPEMNGRDLARSLLECCPHIRSLFMSGYTANVIAHQGVLDKGVNFIQKPFSPRDLARKVREALDG